MLKYKIAFIGRSNVGKSSLINYLLNNNVAKTSKHPGKTRKHDLFSFNTRFDLVDMPGYGFARVEGIKRQIWDEKMQELFFKDPLFKHLFVLIDSSIKPMKIDQEFLTWLIENQIYFSVILTKVDKAKARELATNVASWTNFISLLPNDFGAANIFKASSFLKQGKGDIKQFIEKLQSLV